MAMSLFKLTHRCWAHHVLIPERGEIQYPVVSFCCTLKLCTDNLTLRNALEEFGTAESCG